MSALAARLDVPVEHRVFAFVLALGVILAAATFYVGLASHDRVLTHTVNVKQTIEQQYGAPAQTVDGAQINKALTGLTCDVYRQGPTMICHP